MNRTISIFFWLLSLAVYSQNEMNTVKKEGENIYISSRIDKNNEITYWFRKCMANSLFTFYRVSIVPATGNSRIVNEAGSDNIGPFEIGGGGWCGGNHLFADGKTKTAETFSVELYADGKQISSDTALETRRIKIEVKNYIFNPLSATSVDNKIKFTDTLCIENVTYTINRNNIQVDLIHRYTNKIPVTITKYYGMQSMFKEEKYLLTPSGEYRSWTEIKKADRFKKKDFPRFNRYIEKSDFCFQASFLSDSGLGTHRELPDNDVIFIGNSWTKCYHKLIGNACRIAGDRDTWSGVYTWFAEPLLDTPVAFAYEGIVDGKEVIFFSNAEKGDFIVPLPENLKRKKIRNIENTSDTEIRRKKESVRFHCPLPGSTVIAFEK